MFSGIISQTGTLVARRGGRLAVRTPLRPGLGASVSVSGVCLTVVGNSSGVLSFDVSGETLRRTHLGKLPLGSRLNIESELKAGDPIGGHFVSGHVDAAEKVLALRKLPGGFVAMRLGLGAALKGLVAVKGSVAIEGVSLTVTGLGRDWFETVLIPFTMDNTNLGSKRRGDPVNVEADMLARYVRAALSR